MKYFWTFLVLIFGHQSFGQQVYNLHEVEQQAAPPAGMGQLEEYLQANLQLPIALAAKGLNGRVFVQGIIEPDGSMSDLQVLRSIAPEVDKEVMRILSLFRAWKPAMKGGSPVRQKLVYPAQIRTEANPGYDAQEEVLLEYFNKKQVATQIASEIEYRNYIPVDALGHARGELLFQKKKGDQWKTIVTVPFSGTETWIKLAGPKGADSLQAIVTSTKGSNANSVYEKVIRTPEGRIIAFELYEGNKSIPQVARYYYAHGGIRQSLQLGESIGQKTDWYPNGQIRSIIQFEPESGKGPTILSNWAEDGRPLVVNGEGSAILAGLPREGAWVFDSGMVKDGKQEGLWSGRLADSTTIYEEEYIAGSLQSGTDHLQNYTTYLQTEGSRPPQFKGGLMAMYQFMANSFYFPGTRPKGRVVTSFIVQPDGSIKDLKVLKGIGTEADKEALRVIGLMDGKWDPALYKGRSIASPMSIPVNFQAE